MTALVLRRGLRFGRTGVNEYIVLRFDIRSKAWKEVCQGSQSECIQFLSTEYQDLCMRGEGSLIHAQFKLTLNIDYYGMTKILRNNNHYEVRIAGT